MSRKISRTLVPRKRLLFRRSGKRPKCRLTNETAHQEALRIPNDGDFALDQGKVELHLKVHDIAITIVGPERESERLANALLEVRNLNDASAAWLSPVWTGRVAYVVNVFWLIISSGYLA